MPNLVLVDSCIFIGLLSERRDPAVELLRRTSLDDLATCGMVTMEVLRGVITPKARTRLTDFFNVLQYVPTDNRLWREATELAWQLGRKGITLPLQDILIATCAMRIGAGVLTFDHHFEKIGPSLRVYRSIEELR